MELTHLAATDSEEDILEAIARDGGVIIDGLLSRADLASIEKDLAPYLAKTPNGTNPFAGHRTKRVGALMARSPACRELALHPLVNGLCRQFLSPYSPGYQLHFTQAVSIGPGQGEQLLHRDRGVWGGYINRSIETQFSTIWAITDFTEENGATRIAPGSQRWPADRLPTPADMTSAAMRAGSVLLYSGSVIHGGGTNVSDSSRLGVLLHYTLSWLRQEENQYLSCPPEIARELAPKLRALMGYARGGPVLGFYSTPGAPGEGVEVASPECLFEGAPAERSAATVE